MTSRFKFLLLAFLVAATNFSSWAQILTYTSATTGALNSVATGATGTALARVNGIIAPGAPCGTGFSCSSFSTATTYSTTVGAVEVTVTPNSGNTLNVTGFSVGLRRSSTGPASVRLAYSTNGGTTWVDQGSNQSPSNSACGTTTTGTWTTSFTASSALKFRIYGFNASSTAGTFQVLNLNINGTISSGCTAPTLSTGVTNVNCNGGNNGAITLTTSGGSSPFTFSWSNGATTQNISTLTAGTYSVTVTATGGCTATTTATITQPASLTASISGATTAACGATTAQATVTATGGTTPYSYSWNTTPVQTSTIATGLAPSSYTATITDAHSCTATASTTIAVSALTGLSATGITTSGATLNWTDAGSSASYNVQYRQTGTSTWTTASATARTLTVASLASGTSYEFQVQAVCSGGGTSAFSASGNFTTLVSCTSPSGLAATGIGTTSATLGWTAVSGAAGYNIQYRQTGTTTWSSTSSTVASVSISGLSASTAYEFQVQTTCGASGTSAFTASANFTTSAVSTGSLLSYTTSLTGALNSVATGAIGTALSRVNGAAAPGTACGTGFTATSFTSATTFSTTLPAIEVTLTPNSGNSANVTGFSVDLRRSSTGPASVRLAYSLNGGTTWVDQGADQAPNNAGCGSTSTGTWSVSFTTSSAVKFRVYGFNASSTSGTFQLLNLNINGSLSTSGCTSPSLSTSVTNATCNGGTNGSVTLTATGGTAPYTYSWSNGATTQNISSVAAGTYSVTVTTTTGGCVASTVATVGQPTAVAATISSSMPMACGDTGASATVTATGGTGTYTYSWNSTPTQTSATATGLVAGLYTATVTDANGCTGKTAVNLIGNVYGFSTTGITTTSATLNWTDSGSSTGYNIQYRQVGSSTWTLTSATFTTLTVTGLSAATNYEFQVQAICSGGATSAYSASATFTTNGTSSCAVPTGLNASSVSTTSATLNWSTATGAVSYNIQYRKTGTTTWTTTTSTASPKTISTLTAGTAYEFQVQSVCSGSATSSMSGSANFTTSSGATCDTTLWAHIYTPSRFTILQSCITITGTVANKINEADGDIHIRVTVDAPYTYMLNSSNVSGQHGDLVVEPICVRTVTQASAVSACSGWSQSIYIPNVGEHISATGVFVTDNNHGWNELHPVTTMTIAARGVNPLTGNPDNEGTQLYANDVTVYPNPASTYVDFRLERKPSSIVYISIVDELGRIAGQYQMLETNELRIKTNNLSRGHYFYTVMQDDQKVKSGSLFITNNN